jgi:hypothetical protein
VEVVAFAEALAEAASRSGVGGLRCRRLVVRLVLSPPLVVRLVLSPPPTLCTFLVLATGLDEDVDVVGEVVDGLDEVVDDVDGVDSVSSAAILRRTCRVGGKLSCPPPPVPLVGTSLRTAREEVGGERRARTGERERSLTTERAAGGSCGDRVGDRGGGDGESARRCFCSRSLSRSRANSSNALVSGLQ